MRNIKLTIQYDGTNYHGWQQQENAITVQETVKQAIEKLTGEKTELTGSSRTDAGVHAYGQTANFHTTSKIPEDRFPYALNCFLPEDIVITHSQEVDKDFHSRFCAKGKRYRYLIYPSLYRSALLRNRAYHVKRKLDMEAMEKTLEYFLGKKDFSAFRAAGSDTKTSVRTITDIEIKRQGEVLQFEIAGDGFLYNMVRIIVGTLVDVGTGRILWEDIPGIIDGKDRTKAGKTAPAHGLYLLEVYY